MPECIPAFVRQVAALDGVCRIVVEHGSENLFHIRTDAVGLTEVMRQRIYAIEAETIRQNAPYLFDFHLRHAEAMDEPVAPTPGVHVYVIVNDSDADS